jgi:hypothetical protein
MAIPEYRPGLKTITRSTRDGHQIRRGTHHQLRWPLATLASVLGLEAFVSWSAPAPMIAPWDILILLDGGYRITQGQVPNTDFTNPIGPLTYELVSLGMRLQRDPSLAAVSYGSLIFLVMTSLLAWTVAWRRLQPPYAAGFTIFTAVIIVSVRPLGWAPWISTYAMIYNRYGWVLYTILLLLIFVRPRMEFSRTHPSLDGLILGILTGLLFYCKINFFVMALAAIVVGLALSMLPRRISFTLWCAAGLCAVAGVMRIAFGVQVADYVGNLAAVTVPMHDHHRIMVLLHCLIYMLPIGLLTLAIVGRLIISGRRNHATREENLELWKLGAAAAYIICSSFLVTAGNTSEKYELPALVIIPLLLVYRSGSKSTHIAKPSLISFVVLLLATAGPIAANDIFGLARAAVLNGSRQPVASQQLASDHLRDLVVPLSSTARTAYRTANVVPSMLNNGMDLLRRHIATKDTVFTFALTNPFAFALSLPPGRGGPLWWDLRIDFDQASHPPDAILNDAKWVMIPRMIDGQGGDQETVQVMLDLYRPYLARHFVESERTDDWILLARTE